MTRLYLVRHGTTVWHAENRYAGSSDVALDLDGRTQAKRLAAWSSAAGLASVWSSPLTRARETAAPAASAAGLTLQIDERLRELDFGQIEGKTLTEARKLFPEEIGRFVDDPVTHFMPGGEDPHEAVRRTRAALCDIAAAHPQGRVLIVAHSTCIRLVLCSLLGIALAKYRTVFPAVHNGALTELGVGGPNFSLLQYNSPLPT